MPSLKSEAADLQGNRAPGEPGVQRAVLPHVENQLAALASGRAPPMERPAHSRHVRKPNRHRAATGSSTVEVNRVRGDLRRLLTSGVREPVGRSMAPSAVDRTGIGSTCRPETCRATHHPASVIAPEARPLSGQSSTAPLTYRVRTQRAVATRSCDQVSRALTRASCRDRDSPDRPFRCIQLKGAVDLLDQSLDQRHADAPADLRIQSPAVVGDGQDNIARAGTAQ